MNMPQSSGLDHVALTQLTFCVSYVHAYRLCVSVYIFSECKLLRVTFSDSIIMFLFIYACINCITFILSFNALMPSGVLQSQEDFASSGKTESVCMDCM